MDKNLRATFILPLILKLSDFQHASKHSQTMIQTQNQWYSWTSLTFAVDEQQSFWLTSLVKRDMACSHLFLLVRLLRWQCEKWLVLIYSFFQISKELGGFVVSTSGH